MPTPQLTKLGIVPGARWCVVDADADWSGLRLVWRKEFRTTSSNGDDV
jgi:hypothetical protein